MLILAALLALCLACLAGAVVMLFRSRAAERRYATLLENLPQTSVMLFDEELRFELAAGQSVAASEPESSRMIGRRLEDVVPGEQGQALARHYRAALAGESRSIEYTSRVDGREFWLRLVPVRESGEVTHGLAVAQEITDRKRAEREREDAERRRQMMVDVMNESYVAMDSSGLITDWNERATQTFGYEREEALGRSPKELFIPEEDHDDYDRLIERFAQGERAGRRLDLRADRNAIDRDGRRFTVELAATTLEHAGEITFHTFMHDITDRKRGQEEAAAHAADVEALAEATGALARSTTADEARNAICLAARSIVEADLAVLLEPDGLGSGLRVTSAIGGDLPDGSLPFVGQPSSAVRAFSTMEPRFIAGLAELDPPDPGMPETTGVSSALWVPVVRGKVALGVIAVGWAAQLDLLPERVQRIMGLVAAEAAVAIERAALLDRLQRIARTDDLTGLPNRRSWDEELAREIARAKRERAPLTIAMVDLDHFKAFNDRNGHQAGDRLLKQAAGSWRGALRQTDLIARYGGEEFAIALPNCDGVAGTRLLERLRAVTPSGESCSAGVATWNGEESGDDLVGRADRALYEAKQTGRDRTVTV